METVYRKMDLDTVFPIQSVKDGLIVSKRGDVTIGWELELPVAFSLTEGGYDDILTGAESTLKSLAGPIINVVSIIMGLVGVGMLGVNLYKYFKGDPTSNDALTKIGGGLLVAVIILQVINYTML